jgi:hypothetical protein
MAGKLTIHSVGNGEILSGHSWIEYTPDNGEPTTYGTWGNNPDGKGNGLFENLELGQKSDASRSTHISDKQEKKLLAKIQEYKEKGENGWGYLSPCSTFAADTWENATGEKLAHRSGAIISNPSKLKESIIAANNDDLKKAAKADAQPNPARPSSSRRNVSSAVEPCGGGGW